MDCERCRTVLSAALDGEAGIEELAQARAHLESCTACRDHAAALEQLRERLHEWPDELPAAPAAQPRRRPATALLRWAAALLLASTLGFFAGRRSLRTPEQPPHGDARVFVESTIVVPSRNEIHTTAVLRLADPAAARLADRR